MKSESFPATFCEAPAKAASNARSTGRIGRKILLADDEKFGRDIVAALLERNGHQVTVVDNGAGILEQLQQERFDILLSDISMPGIDGTQVAQLIRSGNREGINPLIPIIAMTAHTFPRDRTHFLECGINGVIAKPVDFAELLGLIEETCNTVFSGFFPVPNISDRRSPPSHRP
jgi:CheY-like chemotaxis protein